MRPRAVVEVPRMKLGTQTTCQVPVELAEEIGLNEAILLMQLDFWIKLGGATPEKHHRDGRWWTYQSVRSMAEAIKILSKDTIDRAIKSLERAGLIVLGNYNERAGDRTRWIAIDYEACSRLRACRDRVEVELSQDETGVSQDETGCVSGCDDVTRDYLPEITTKSTPPPPQAGETPSPLPQPGMATGTSEPTPEQQREPDPPPPTPAPASLEAAEQRMLDFGRSLDRQSKRMKQRRGEINGWSDQNGARLIQLKDRLDRAWQQRKPSLASDIDPRSLAEAVAPDRVEAFEQRTGQYLKSKQGDYTYLWSLENWVRKWQKWAPDEQSASSTAKPGPLTEVMEMAAATRRANKRLEERHAHVG